ncbi:MAG: MBL fold metallo-hydrolase [Clostridia bacterium]|nr:MBL fold metallo-hydrolase [Clostridia bacterium]
MRKNFIISVLLGIMCALTGCSQSAVIPPSTPAPAITAEPTEPPVSELTVHFIDVGQADAAILQCEGETMIIDGGNRADSDLIAAYLKKLNVEHIDYMICTHAHEDHVGGLSAPLSMMPVGAVYAPAAESDSKAYQTFKQKVTDQNTEIIHPVNYEIIGVGSARTEILASPADADNLNNTSIILKVTHKNNSFLFTGDAEREEEQTLLDRGLLKADVLKVGHHGSDTSTSYPFLREVMPEYAVISVGKNNSYGHPSEAVLSRLRDAGAQVYRTDMQGDIIMRSDGDNITVTTAKNETIQTNETAAEYNDGIYIGNKRSKKLHRPDCNTLPSEKNRVEFNSFSDAVNEGYSPCGNCMKK